MLMRKKTFVFVVTLGVALVAVALLHGQGATSATDQLSALLAKRVERVARWKLDAGIILAMTIGVGVLGIVTGVLQGWKASWAKPATVAVGMLVSILTFIQATVYKVDHHTLKRAARRAERLIEDAEMVLAQLPEGQVGSPEDWAIFAEGVTEKIDQIDAIDDQLSAGTVDLDDARVAGISIDWVRSAEAAETPKQPAWVAKTPTSSEAIFFVGLAISDSLRVAKEESEKDALEQALSHFALHAAGSGSSQGFEPDLLAERIVKGSAVESSFYSWDEPSGSWRFYTLMRIAKKAIVSAVDFYSIEQQQRVPPDVVRALGAAPASSSTYNQQRLEAHAALMLSTRELLSAEELASFRSARDLRRNGETARASEILAELVGARERFYLGWRDLARAYGELGRTTDAATAWERAVELEPEQPVRDASPYYGYGELLLRQERHEEAILQLEKALEISPDSAQVKRALLEARRALESGD
jgi:hypothetical protein